MTRKTPPAYSDGVYMMSGQDRPSPRRLSTLFMKGSDGLPSAKNRTALLAFFGTRAFKFEKRTLSNVRYGIVKCNCLWCVCVLDRSSRELRNRNGQRKRLSDRSTSD